MTTKETENLWEIALMFLCFGDIRWSHLDCISGPTSSYLGYISRHTAVTMGLYGFTQPSVLCMLGHRSGPAHQFRKNQFGGCGTDIYIYIHTDIYICHIIYMRDLDDTLDVWCFPASLSIGGSVAGKGGVAHIAAHSSPTGLREVALSETVL